MAEDGGVYEKEESMSEINNTTVSSKFRFFEKVTLTDKIFSWKIAFFNTMAFCLIVGVDTYDLRLLKIPFKCPWGYWILVWAVPLLIGNYFLSRTKHWITQVLSPYLFSVGINWLVSIINFKRPSGNLYLFQLLNFALFPLLGVMTSVIRHYVPHAPKETNLDDVNSQARIQWITESINMWRALAITIITAIIPCIVFSFKNGSDWTISSFEVEQRSPIMDLLIIQGAGIVFYVLFGPIYECFRKTDYIKNMLLDIKK